MAAVCTTDGRQGARVRDRGRCVCLTLVRLCEIVFGSVPLAATGGERAIHFLLISQYLFLGRRAFKAHWFRGVLCLSFLSGRSSALCVAFVFADQSSDVLHSSGVPFSLLNFCVNFSSLDAYIDTVLALWPLLRSSSSSLAALTAAAARVASLCPLRFVPPPMLPLPLPAPSVAAARAVDTLMLDLPASAKASDCLLAFLVASPPARNLGSVNFPRCLPLFVGAPPPPLPPSRWAVRATHCAGNQRAVAEMQRALALRVEALLAWQVRVPSF